MASKPVPRLDVGKWFVTYNLDPEHGRSSRVFTLNWWWPREKGSRFGYCRDWYDGWHFAFTVGPINLYWNFECFLDSILNRLKFLHMREIDVTE